MSTNRIFICHTVRNEKPEEAQILRYITEILGKTGMEVITQRNDGPEESFFQQLQEALPTCQAFLLLHTSDALYATRVHMAVKAAKHLFDQKILQGIFRFVCSPSTEATIPKEWKGLTTFDGTRDYQRASTKLVMSILAKSKNRSRTVQVVLNQEATSGAPSPLSPVVGNGLAQGTGEGQAPSVSTDPTQPSTTSVNSTNRSVPLVPLDAIPTSAIPALGRISETNKSSETNPVNTIEALPTTAMPALGRVSATDKPPGINTTPEIAPTNALPVLRRKTNLPQMPVRTNYDRPPKPSIWKKLAEQRKTITVILIALVVLTLIGSVGTFFFLNPNSSKTVTQPAAPPPNPIVGQVRFLNSGQIGIDNSTGVCDQIRITLKDLKSPPAGSKYYAWLLGNSSVGSAIFLGDLTVNNREASLTYTHPTHDNLLLTQSRFLITEESSSPPPKIPSPDQRVWRYFGLLSQIPSQQEIDHLSNYDHIQHLLATDTTLQHLEMKGGLTTWLYENVKKVHEWAHTVEGKGEKESLPNAHFNLVRILDYLDGPNFVAGDVPKGTPFSADPTTSRIPILSVGPDPAKQNPAGYIHHILNHLQGVTTSPNATDGQRTLTSEIYRELDKVNGSLEKVREDAKKLVNMPLAKLGSSEATPIITDLVDQVDSAFAGELDPATNKRQGGVTLIQDTIPQIATIDVREFRGL